jgi:hypothetical protein
LLSKAASALIGAMQWSIFAAVVCAVQVVAASAATTGSVASTVVGIVKSADGKPIPYATVDVYDGPTRLTTVPEPVTLAGRFSIGLGSFSGSHVSCIISAKGYLPRRLTVEMGRSHVADAREVTLERLRTLVAGPVSATAQPNGSTAIDVFFRDEAPQPVEVFGVRLRATARRKTNCLDLRPSLIVNVTETFRPSVVDGPAGAANLVTPADGWTESVGVTGRIERLPCDQGYVDLSIPVHFKAKSGADEHLRFNIPAHLKTTSGAIQEVSLSKWESVVVTFELANGQRVDAVF